MDFSTDHVTSWTCHLHNKETCVMKYYNGNYYHVIPVKNISVLAQTYNSQKIPDEFWEDLGKTPYMTPIYYSDCINDVEMFRIILELFKNLDDNSLKFSTLNTPSDFIKRHVITDGIKMITLCNKHLLKSCKKKDRAQVFYTKDAWIKCILKGLFPKIDSPEKSGIPTNTPDWAIKLYPRGSSSSATRNPKSN
ncbi:GrBNV_gp93-like protein [Drosophila innubila nudivirus]|uniref:GrBNV_gp93-like protein n=1 Tax=Drosophila innubila nudivirus TaxID=2057187 RepID=A0A2H4UX58_9VIRU|nr:GrBNV_gp93-like protein [Drosophila innubila nudivirus]ATZ81496.1 GrBNV_gp93-like protein [Drosophila innubila nudivirus]